MENESVEKEHQWINRMEMLTLIQQHFPLPMTAELIEIECCKRYQRNICGKNIKILTFHIHIFHSISKTKINKYSPDVIGSLGLFLSFALFISIVCAIWGKMENL